MRTLDIDTTEALFKLALERKDYSEVMRMVRTYRTGMRCVVVCCIALHCTYHTALCNVALSFVHYVAAQQYGRI